MYKVNVMTDNKAEQHLYTQTVKLSLYYQSNMAP